MKRWLFVFVMAFSALFAFDGKREDAAPVLRFGAEVKNGNYVMHIVCPEYLGIENEYSFQARDEGVELEFDFTPTGGSLAQPERLHLFILAKNSGEGVLVQIKEKQCFRDTEDVFWKESVQMFLEKGISLDLSAEPIVHTKTRHPILSLVELKITSN